MKLQNKNKRNDVFANIGTMSILSEGRNLEAPFPPVLEEKYLPVRNDAGAAFQPLEKLCTQEQLLETLKIARTQYAEFMQDLAPELPSVRKRLNLKKIDWRLQTADDIRNFSGVQDGDGEWEQVSIPHFGGPLGVATAYYRTEFTLTQEYIDIGAAFICFGGVDYKAHVFVNGMFLGSHEGFFAPFEFDISRNVRVGVNTLVVTVENDLVNGAGDKIYAATGVGYDDPQVGWHHCPPGMGIYQKVFVELRPRQHVQDIYVRPLPELNRIEAHIEVFNCDLEPADITVELSVFGQNFTDTAVDRLLFNPACCMEVGVGDTLTEANLADSGRLGKQELLFIEKGINFLCIPLELPDARIWEIEKPWLYQLQIKLLDKNGNIIDTGKRQFGMRSFHMDKESQPKGKFYLNNRQLRLRGSNTMGHEQQCVVKENWAQLRDDILLAKICNMNFLRITQRPVQPEIYDFCDRLGLLVQTDLPLFGKLRRNQVCEAIRQAGEMEHLVRSHPCVVMDTYINEPFPNSDNKPQRNISRPELMEFFRAADIVVHLQNPDRVIKHVDGDYDPPDEFPDNHCYTGWYNGHGLDMGKLLRGYWLQVRPGWHCGCGEFGAEGLDPVTVMQRYYPKDWLPQNAQEEKNWSPNSINSAQTGKFHYFFYETPDSLDEWVKDSHRHQAWSTRFMTEAYRRNSRMNTFAIHLFIDAFPSGWMKAIMDFERRPKPAYFAYRDALAPLLPNLRTDRFTYFEKEDVKLEAWICNDPEAVPEGCSLRYQVEMGGSVLFSGSKPAEIPSCSSRFQGYICFRAPQVSERSMMTARLAIINKNGDVLNDTELTLEVFPAIEALVNRTAVVIGQTGGKADALVEELSLEKIGVEQANLDTVLLCDNYESFSAVAEKCLKLVEKGCRIIFVELPVGEYKIAGSQISVKKCNMAPRHFVSRKTEHTLVTGFKPRDFRLWYDPAEDCIAALLDTTFSAEGFDPVLISGNTNDSGDWNVAFAAAEKRLENGSIIISQIKLAGRTKSNPIADRFARNLLG